MVVFALASVLPAIAVRVPVWLVISGSKCYEDETQSDAPQRCFPAARGSMCSHHLHQGTRLGT